MPPYRNRSDQQHSNMRHLHRPSSDFDSGESDCSYEPPPVPVPRRNPRGRSTTMNDSIIMNQTFQKLLCLLLFVIVFDLIYMWDYFDGIEGDASDGPEAGMHNLHQKNRLNSIYSHILSGLQIGENQPQQDENNFPPVRISTYNMLSDTEKVEELEHEVLEWKKKYETAMANLGQNPYPEGKVDPKVPFTLVPPNMGTDDFKPKKSKEELEAEDIHGADPRIAKILHSASVEIDEELAGQLPTWDDVVAMYGDEPIINGLETCEEYRANVEPKDRMIGPAGMFNTGTNLLFELMKTNCDIPEAHDQHREPRQNGMRWQVPWGKHNPPNTHRFKNIAKAWGMHALTRKAIKQDDFMPVVLIKDPYTWMASQCRHKYTTFWGHDDQHCPNLIRWRIPDKDVPSEVRVKFALEMKLYESLLVMWNKWYEEWEKQTFPHLTTRFEDLLFHGEEVTRKACECVGGTFTDNYVHAEDSAKPARGVHTGANGLVKAMLQYGDKEKRLVGFTDRDRWYASKNADTELMKNYAYPAPPLPSGEPR